MKLECSGIEEKCYVPYLLLIDLLLVQMFYANWHLMNYDYMSYIDT